MKNDNASKISYIEKARKITSREYLMKLIYQIDMLEGDLQNINDCFEDFLVNHEEYIINRYEELGNALAVNQYRALIDEFRENGTISIQAINNAGKTSTRPVNSATTTIKIDFPTNATLRRRRNR